MTNATQSAAGTWAWICVVALALGGYFGGIAPAEKRLRTVSADAHDLYDLANRNERLLRAATGLSDARARVALDVARLAAVHGSGSATLRTLELLRREGSHAHVTIVSITPDAPNAAAETTGSEALTIGVHGAYRNVLAAIADVSRHEVLLDISDAVLAAAAAGPGEVDATLHATLYYRMDALAQEKQDETVDPR